MKLIEDLLYYDSSRNILPKMTHFGLKFLTSLGLLICCTLPIAGSAQEYTKTILVISPADKTEQIAEIVLSLEAHISDFNVTVRAEEIDKLPSNFSAQTESARAALNKQNALAVLWLDFKRELVMILLVPRSDLDIAGTEQLLDRPLSPHTTNWREECEAIAAVTRSVLAPWLSRHKPPSLLQANDEETPWRLKEQVAPEIGFWKGLSWELYVSGGYTNVYVSGTDTIQQGAQLEIGIISGKYLQLDIGLGLLADIEIPHDDYSITLRSIPFSVGLGGILPLKDLSLGLNLALLLDFTVLNGVAKVQPIGDTNRMSPAFSPSLFLRYNLLDWFALWIDVGTYIFGTEYDYTIGSKTIQTISAIQVHGVLGLTLFINMKKE